VRGRQLRRSIATLVVCLAGLLAVLTFTVITYQRIIALYEAGDGDVDPMVLVAGVVSPVLTFIGVIFFLASVARLVSAAVRAGSTGHPRRPVCIPRTVTVRRDPGLDAARRSRGHAQFGGKWRRARFARPSLVQQP
jgi:uncharacterized membrane protein